MTIRVYHNPHFLDRFGEGVLTCIDLACLYLAAIVDTDEPAEAFRATQHLSAPWFDHPAVTTVVRSRSTSVGDVLATGDGRLLSVMPAGFRELDCTLPARESALAQKLDALAAALPHAAGVDVAETVVDEVTAQVQHLHTALLFAVPLLERVADAPDGEDPYLAHLARFAAQQAQWVLRQCSGQAPVWADGRTDDELAAGEEEE